MMSDLRFRDRLDSELENIEFTTQNKLKVLERTRDMRTVQKRQAAKGLQRINRFLETELRIPVKPLAVALLITLSGLVYGCIGAASVSAEEMQKSSITVMDGNHGGQTNDLFKN